MYKIRILKKSSLLSLIYRKDFIFKRKTCTEKFYYLYSSKSNHTKQAINPINPSKYGAIILLVAGAVVAGGKG